MSTNLKECEQIKNFCMQREIKRLCHITPISNLKLIGETVEGLCSTQQLIDSGREFNRTDFERRDGQLNSICCTIEFPNAYYMFNVIRFKGINCIVLHIEPNFIWDSETLFCPLNAAKAQGEYICQGLDCFKSLYTEYVDVLGTLKPCRSFNQFKSVPTDLQSEVLVRGPIPHNSITEIVVNFEHHAEKVYEILQCQNNLSRNIPIKIIPDYFRKIELKTKLHGGIKPDEEIFCVEKL